MVIKPFIFGSNLAPAKTYEELKNEQALAERTLRELAAAYTTDPQRAATRLGAEIGTIIRQAILASKLKEYDKKGGALFSELMSELLGGTSAGAVNAGSGVWAPGAIKWPQGSIAPKTGKGAKLDPAKAKTLVEGASYAARELGVKPEDILAIASYESAGTFNPSIRGPKTKYGRPIGLFQFLPENAAKYGVDPNDPMSQFRALVQYARDRGYKPGMGVEALYATINAGAPHRLNARDAAQGGAPGTVLEKVRQQFGPHYKKAITVLEIAKAAGVDPDKLASALGVRKSQTFNMADEPTRMAMEKTIASLGGSGTSAQQTAQPTSDDTPRLGDALNDFVRREEQAVGNQSDSRTSGMLMPELPPIPAPPPAPSITPPAQREKLYTTFMRTLQRVEMSPFLSPDRKEALKLAVKTRLEALNQRFKAEDMQYQAWKDAYAKYYENLAGWARKYNEMMLNARLNPMQVSPGQVVYDPITRKPLYRAPDKLTELERMVAIENERRRKMGLPPMTPFEMKLLLQKAGAAQVNVNTAEAADQAARKALIGETVKTFKPILEFAQDAPLFEARLNALEELLKGQQTGGLPGHLKQQLAQWGFGSDRNQAIVGIINWMVPRLRSPGMGVLNESEYQMIYSTLPMLTRAPGANEVMMKLLKADFQLKKQTADLVRRFQLGEIDYQTLLRETAALRERTRAGVETDIKAIMGIASSFKQDEQMGAMQTEPMEIAPMQEQGVPAPPPDVPERVKELWQFMTPDERKEVLKELQK